MFRIKTEDCLVKSFIINRYIKHITFTEIARKSSFCFEFKRKIAYSNSTCLSSASILVKISERAYFISSFNLRLFASYSARTPNTQVSLKLSEREISVRIVKMS